MKTFLKPAPQRVVALPDKAPDKVGAIYIPDSNQQEKPKMAEVVAVGSGDEHNPMLYEVGDKVMMGQFAGTEIELSFTGDTVTYLVLNQMDIMGKVIEV